MADTYTFQDMTWTQDGAVIRRIDLSHSAESIPKRVSDFAGYTFQLFWDGAPEGNIRVQQSNAGVGRNAGEIVEPAHWVEIPLGLELTQGAGSPDADVGVSPALLEVTSGRSGWVRIVYEPTNEGSGSGTLGSRFDGVRR